MNSAALLASAAPVEFTVKAGYADAAVDRVVCADKAFNGHDTLCSAQLLPHASFAHVIGAPGVTPVWKFSQENVTLQYCELFTRSDG